MTTDASTVSLADPFAARARLARARLAACRDAAESGNLAAAARLCQQMDPNGDWADPDPDFEQPTLGEILAALEIWELEI